MAFALPKLNYDYAALEPHIDARTMEIHHTKHHQGYVSKLNDAVSGTQLENGSIEDILAGISRLSVAVRNNGGGHFNHSLFWKIMTPGGGGLPEGDLLDALKANFGSFDQFREQFSNAALTRFGSGWAWLVQSGSRLVITSTPNQDNPMMDVAEVQGNPLLGIDVWEHAYYLKYQNRRNEYVEAFWNVIDWTAVGNRLQ
ncbi:MAG: superoxide dismutase [Bacteroidales bacterium]|nr:superoxide dismutase [Bacteroidales bacterium]